MTISIAFAVFAVIVRVATLVVSMRNEARLKAAGAVEFGAGNTTLVALAHTAFYAAAIVEGFRNGAPSLDGTSAAGFAIYAFGMVSLAFVLHALGRQWTVKLIVSPRHSLVRSGIYRYAKHPNYYWNILPELVGFALTLHAFWTLAIGIPLYLIPLGARIALENRVMKEKFAEY